MRADLTTLLLFVIVVLLLLLMFGVGITPGKAW